jgi:hypothetical protein
VCTGNHNLEIAKGRQVQVCGLNHSDKELIPRIPIFITTNHDIWTWVCPDDIAPLKQRIISYKLTHTITNAINHEGFIEKPPLILTHHDLDALIIHNYDDIILSLGTRFFSTTTMNFNHKKLSSDILQKMERLQANILLLQDPTSEIPTTSHASE